MREISINKRSDNLEKAVIQAIREIKPPVINNPAPIVEIKTDQKRPSYRIEVERDGHGRIQAMVVTPHELG